MPLYMDVHNLLRAANAEAVMALEALDQSGAWQGYRGSLLLVAA